MELGKFFLGIRKEPLKILSFVCMRKLIILYLGASLVSIGARFWPDEKNENI